MLPTPVNGAFYPIDAFDIKGFEGVKEGCETEVHAEILARNDWARSASPPMTPGKSFALSFVHAKVRRGQIRIKGIPWHFIKVALLVKGLSLALIV